MKRQRFHLLIIAIIAVIVSSNRVTAQAVQPATDAPTTAPAALSEGENQPDPSAEPLIDIEAARAAVKPILRPTKPVPAEPSSAEERKVHVKPMPGETLELGIKELGNFEYDPEKGGLPADVQALDGVTFRTSGFMIPMNQADDITEFSMVVDLFSCCFGQPPGLQHSIHVRTPPGKAVSYYNDMLVVEGVLHVREQKEEGYVIGIFDLDATSVRPAPK